MALPATPFAALFGPRDLPVRAHCLPLPCLKAAPLFLLLATRRGCRRQPPAYLSILFALSLHDRLPGDGAPAMRLHSLRHLIAGVAAEDRRAGVRGSSVPAFPSCCNKLPRWLAPDPARSPQPAFPVHAALAPTMPCCAGARCGLTSSITCREDGDTAVGGGRHGAGAPVRGSWFERFRVSSLIALLRACTTVSAFYPLGDFRCAFPPAACLPAPRLFLALFSASCRIYLTLADLLDKY